MVHSKAKALGWCAVDCPRLDRDGSEPGKQVALGARDRRSVVDGRLAP